MVSVTEPPRGGHQTKEKPFTLYCLLPQRAHISFLTLSYTSLIFFPFIFSPLLLSPCTSFFYLYFIKFDVLTMPFERASLSKTQRGQRGKKKTFWSGEDSGGRPSPHSVNSGGFLKSGGAGRKSHLNTWTSHVDNVQIAPQASHNSKSL